VTRVTAIISSCERFLIAGLASRSLVNIGLTGAEKADEPRPANKNQLESRFQMIAKCDRCDRKRAVRQIPGRTNKYCSDCYPYMALMAQYMGRATDVRTQRRRS
jgi:hypothetical protein